MLEFALFEVFLVSVLPITLITFGIIPKKFRLLVLAGVVALVAFLIQQEGLTATELGWRTDNLLPGAYYYAVATVAAVLVLAGFARLLKNRTARALWYKDPHFLGLFIPISFAQQFLFQGFILLELQSVLSATAAVLITALIFGYLHTIYPNPVRSFLLGTVGGLFFGTLYTFFPNLIVSSIVHSILNFAAVYNGFFTFTHRGAPRVTSLRLKNGDQQPQ